MRARLALHSHVVCSSDDQSQAIVSPPESSCRASAPGNPSVDLGAWSPIDPIGFLIAPARICLLRDVVDLLSHGRPGICRQEQCYCDRA